MTFIFTILLAALAAVPHPFEITTNKPFVPVTVNDSKPLWFILDSGNNGSSIIARECADRLGLERDADAKVDVGAGAGADVRMATGSQTVTIHALGESLSVPAPRLLTLAHVSRTEGRRVDGLLGLDFFSQHVIEIDYARGTMTPHDPTDYVPPRGATVVPLDLETGWPIVEGSITPPAGKPIPCRLIVDTGVRFTIALFHPFSQRNQLYERGALHRVVIGAGAGGLSRGDVGRLATLSIGGLSFQKPVAMFSRDTTGVFALDGPDGIVGGELLRRHRVTFDYPHRRMILEPVVGPHPSFEFDMTGVFLGADAPDYERIRVIAVNPETPAAAAGLREDDEIVSIDGRRSLTIDQARALFRTPGVRRLEVRRGERLMQMRLEARRMV